MKRKYRLNPKPKKVRFRNRLYYVGPTYAFSKVRYESAGFLTENDIEYQVAGIRSYAPYHEQFMYRFKKKEDRNFFLLAQKHPEYWKVL